MAITVLSHRGFWTRMVVFGTGLLVYVWGMRLMAREHSIAGVALFSLLILFNSGGLIVTLMRRPPRRTR